MNSNSLKLVAKAAPKVTLPSPSTMHFYGTTDYGPPAVYGDFASFFADLGRAFAEEIAALSAAGCRYVQLDEVSIVLLADPLIRAHVKQQGADPDKLVDLYIGVTNQALAGRPADMAVGFHICRGNYKGRYLGEGGYDALAERIFDGINATHFLLEYDTPRAGGFAPLRAVPKSKGVVLGLISSKVPELEDLDLLKRQVRRGRTLYRPRPARGRSSMWLRECRCRESHHRGRPTRQVAPRSRIGRRDLELNTGTKVRPLRTSIGSERGGRKLRWGGE